MKKYYNGSFNIWMTRDLGLELFNLVSKDDTLSKYTKKNIKKLLWEHLRPFYLYQVECSDCGKTIDVTFEKKMTQKEVELSMDQGNGLGILCSTCLNDYK